MRFLVNSREMRQYDKNTTEFFKVPSLILMEQAAIAACEEIVKSADKKESILIVCGNGNNGGDGLAIGRLLLLKGYDIDLVLICFLGKSHRVIVEVCGNVFIYFKKFIIVIVNSGSYPV